MIEIVRGAGDPDEAKALLSAEIGLSDKQADAVIKMRLSQLTRLERRKVDEELAELKVKIAEYEAILADPQRLDGLIRKELEDIAEKYGDARRTAIVGEDETGDEESEVPRKNILLCVTLKGYVNSTECEAYRPQGRGGKGVIGIRTKGGDGLRTMVYATTHHDLLVFTDRARVFKLPTARLPIAGRDSVGKNLRHFLEMEPDEVVRAVVPVEDYGRGYLLLATRQGIVNKNALSDYANAHTKGILAHSAPPEDRLVEALPSDGGGDVILATARGQIIRFSEGEVRITRRPSKGVIGIRVNAGDFVVGMVTVPPGEEKRLLLVTAHGYGKRVDLSDIPSQRRGGKGVIGIKLEGASPVVAVLLVAEDDEVVLSTTSGKVIRFPVGQVSTFSRYARGVRLIRLNKGDQVASAVVI